MFRNFWDQLRRQLAEESTCIHTALLDTNNRWQTVFLDLRTTASKTCNHKLSTRVSIARDTWNRSLYLKQAHTCPLTLYIPGLCSYSASKQAAWCVYLYEVVRVPQLSPYRPSMPHSYACLSCWSRSLNQHSRVYRERTSCI